MQEQHSAHTSGHAPEGTGTPGSPPPRRGARAQIAATIGVILAAVIFALGMIVSYSEALTSPQPNHVTLAVAGNAEAIIALQQQDSLEISVVADEAAARVSVQTRETEAAILIPEPGGKPVTVYVASGASRAIAHSATAVGEQLAASMGTAHTVIDVAPPAQNNPNGTLGFYLIVFLTIGASAGGALLNRPLGPIRDAATLVQRGVAVLLLSALLSACASYYATSIYRGVTGAHGLAFFGALLCYCLAVSGAVTAITSLGGKGAGMAVTLTLLLLGNPASGGPFGVHMQNDLFQALHWVMPQTWGLDILRGIEFFDSNGIGAPLLALSLWALLGLVAATLSIRKQSQAAGLTPPEPSLELAVITTEPKLSPADLWPDTAEEASLTRTP